MTEPLVCAVMLVSGRDKMVRRAVASFRAQGYENKVLVIWDTGVPRVPVDQHPFERVWWWTGEPKSIGALRNDVITWALAGPRPHPEIFCHFDSDDLSHPQRIAEQVALLQASGADCVGYREAVFYDTRPGQFCGAWVYRTHDTAYAIGASLCYWRRTWERVPFNDVNVAEDRQFTSRVNTVGVSGIVDGEPRLICGIHGGASGGNTANYSKFSKQTWRRCPELDAYCLERMRLDAIAG